MRGRTLAAALAVGALALAACGDSEDEGTSAATTAPADDGSDTTAATGGGAGEPGAFAAEHYTTDLTGACPETIVAQNSWLAEPEFAATFQLIGGGGEMGQNTYTGPLGSTGVNLQILDGGPGNDFAPVPQSLYAGNLVLGITPDIGLYGVGDAVAQSGQFPTIAVLHTLQKDPQNLVYDPETYTLSDVDSVVAAVDEGAQLYVTSKVTGYVQYLIGRGVSEGAIIEGFGGDYDRFVTAGGTLINQGYSTDTNFRLTEELPEWGRPVDDVYVSDLGYDAYPISVFVATERFDELSPCLELLVPLMQQAVVDYAADPTEVNELIAQYNDEGHGASFWLTSVEHNQAAHDVMIEDELISNGEDDTLGNDEVGKTEALLPVILPILEQIESDTYDPDVTADDLFTDEFIDPAIGLP